MPRGKTLTEKEKGAIEAYWKSGESMRAIARKINRSHHVVQNFLANPAEYGTKKHPGRPSKLSPRDKRKIIATASNTTKSLTQIRNDCNLNVSRETIRRVLKNSPNIVRSKMLTAPLLTPFHKEKRLEFARLNMNRQWNMVSYAANLKFGCTK